jgi:hypothetical protein
MTTPRGKTHGIDEAIYAGGPGEPYYQPFISCLCGWSSGRCIDWESAGHELDNHLAAERERKESR